jgi:hypothetical protein
MSEYDLFFAGRDAEVDGDLERALDLYGRAMDKVDEGILRGIQTGVPFDDPLALRIERALGRVEYALGL